VVLKCLHYLLIGMKFHKAVYQCPCPPEELNIDEKTEKALIPMCQKHIPKGFFVSKSNKNPKMVCCSHRLTEEPSDELKATWEKKHTAYRKQGTKKNPYHYRACFGFCTCSDCKKEPEAGRPCPKIVQGRKVDYVCDECGQEFSYSAAIGSTLPFCKSCSKDRGVKIFGKCKCCFTAICIRGLIWRENPKANNWPTGNTFELSAMPKDYAEEKRKAFRELKKLTVEMEAMSVKETTKPVCAETEAKVAMGKKNKKTTKATKKSKKKEEEEEEESGDEEGE
jgi:hypothetical protein